jgi:UDPglucose--hexose-1-phosphate uridylyltransferase
MPYMLWIHQRPTDGGDWPEARVLLTIAPQLRAPGTPRFVAAAELGGGILFNPVDPADAARSLRDLPGVVT